MRARVIGAIAGALLVGVLMRDAKWNDLLLAGWVALVASWGGLWLHHRRDRERLGLIELDQLAQWRKVGTFTDWPRWHAPCGSSVHSWKQMKAHVCPAELRQEAPSGPVPAPQPWPGTPMKGGGAGSVDTLTDEPAGRLEGRGSGARS